MDFLPSLYSKLEFNTIIERISRYAASEPGRKLVSQVSPCGDLSELILELNLVSEAKKVLENEGSCPLDGIKEIGPHIQKASVENSFLSPHELLEIRSTQQAARLLTTFFKKRSKQYPRLYELTSDLFVDRVLEYNIDQAIDEEGKVKDSASKELLEIRGEIIRRSDELRIKLEAILESASKQGYAQEEIITTRDGRMVIPVRVEHKHHVPGFIHSSSASGATVFVEPAETLELNNEIRSLQFSEQREVERILRELTAEVRELSLELQSSLKILARLDFLFAKAKYSIEILGAQPQVTARPPLRLIDARHPILLQKHRRDEVVPLTLEIGEEFNALVITGPNAGGKTVALKTAGLLALMASCGLHIPASPDSSVPLFKRIFIDIGDQQSIENDLSSFSSHLMNLKGILEEADSASLVLLDEIGSGTDPAEGGAIAAAFLKSLSDKNCLTIATTHHGELKAFAHETPNFANGSMEFDQTTLRPTYKFRPGIPGSSYALEIAQRLGIPDELLSRAREFLGSGRNRLEMLLSQVEKTSQQLERELQEAASRNAYLSRIISQYEEKLKGADVEIRKRRKAALEEAEQLLEKTNALIEATISEIRSHQAERQVVRNGKKAVEDRRIQVRGELQRVEMSLRPRDEDRNFVQGDYVKLLDGTEIGMVSEVLDEGKTLVVEFGNARLRVDRERLTRAEKPPASRGVIAAPEESRPPRKELDVRGLVAEEALRLVDKFLDDATLASVETVRLIHGKGTGALRRRITEYLTKDGRVRSFRLGEWNEGGTGVTIVELRS